jgi:hypothetical protein
MKSILWSIYGLVTGKYGPRTPSKELEPLVAYYRPLLHRGYDQWLCWISMLKHKKETGSAYGYCVKCKHYLKMTCMESNGYSRECRKAHYRFEAT